MDLFEKNLKLLQKHDPALASDEKTLKEYDVASFLRAWESSRRLAYISQA